MGIQLNDDCGVTATCQGGIRLADDVGTYTEVDTSPQMTIFKREVIGRNDAGDRVFGWAVFATQVPVAMYVMQTEFVDGVEIVKVKGTALYQGEDLPSTIALSFEYGPTTDLKTLNVFRVTEVFQNGARLEFQGERVVSAEPD